MGLIARTRARLAGLAPWAGLVAAGTGWGLHQQVVADALHFDCTRTAGATGIAWGLACVAIVLAGASVSWRARPAAGASAGDAPLRRFIVHLGLMAAALATLGIGLNILAGLLLPGCRP
jgi:hypothetical protein